VLPGNYTRHAGFLALFGQWGNFSDTNRPNSANISPNRILLQSGIIANREKQSLTHLYGSIGSF
jgi:hypothetical protein